MMLRRLGTTLLTVPLAVACDDSYAVGRWTCTESPLIAPEGGAAGTHPEVTVPWSTSFEDGFCGYTDAAGFCYSDPGASYELATNPVRTGTRAAAFRIDSASTDARQARCVREGVLPEQAYYGAWYFIPSERTDTDNWNLFHFQGAPEGDPLYGLWDVSLVDAPDGGTVLAVRDFLGGRLLTESSAPAIPIGSWFHVEMFLRRAADATGEVTVRQDGVIAYQLVNLVTDDSEWGQWYVGNLAVALSPSESTVYIDDVEIRETR